MACRRRRTVITCQACGKKFETSAARAGSKWCSLACRERGRAATGIERIVMRALDSIGVSYRREEPVGRWAVDLFVPEWRLAIEVDSSFWHNDRITAERRAGIEKKTAAIRRRGWILCRIPEAAWRGTPIRDRPSATLAIICAALVGSSPSPKSND
jgi:very-short-patch-repair endonuclease